MSEELKCVKCIIKQVQTLGKVTEYLWKVGNRSGRVCLCSRHYELCHGEYGLPVPRIGGGPGVPLETEPSYWQDKF